MLVPWPGVEPVPSAMKAQSPNHWTTREFPKQHKISEYSGPNVKEHYHLEGKVFYDLPGLGADIFDYNQNR